MLMVAALAGTAQAGLLAEFTFDTDATDTAGGHDGILSSATVAGGVLTLDAGGYMDLAATFGAVNPFDGSGDFRIEMDYKTTAGVWRRNVGLAGRKQGMATLPESGKSCSSCR